MILLAAGDEDHIDDGKYNTNTEGKVVTFMLFTVVLPVMCKPLSLFMVHSAPFSSVFETQCYLLLWRDTFMVISYTKLTLVSYFWQKNIIQSGLKMSDANGV